MSFEIFYDTQPLDVLKKLDKYLAKRIADKLDALLLPDNPVPHSAKAIVGEHGVFSGENWRLSCSLSSRL